MSSRVRFIGTHPNYGSVTGGKLVYYIKHSWDSRFPRGSDKRTYPFGYKKWPHWKRTLWMANMEGTWKVKVFREPRGTNIKKSLYGKRMLELGVFFNKPKKRLEDKLKQADRIFRNVPAMHIPVDGVMPPPNQVRFQNDWNPWGGQVQQVAGNQAQVAPIPQVIRHRVLDNDF